MLGVATMASMAVLTIAVFAPVAAKDIGIDQVYVVGNRVRGESDWTFIQAESPVPVLGYLSANPELTEADMRGEGVFDVAPRAVEEVRAIVAKLEAL